MTSPSEFNIWQHKPWWCQPWSIVLTGMGIIGGSWLLLHRIWLTGLVAVPVSTWMGFFLLVYPRLMSQSIGLNGLHEAEAIEKPD